MNFNKNENSNFNKIIFALAIVVLLQIPLFSQLSANIIFDIKFNSQKIILNRNYFSSQLNDSISFSKLKFYISNLELTSKNNSNSQPIRNYFLLDLENPNSLTIKIPRPKSNFDNLKFNLGIDSLTNVLGAMSGALDPTNGMYWAWHSGYINLKLEGSSNSCKTRNHQFQYHLGGYSFPNNALQTISLPCKKEAIIKMELNLNEVIQNFETAEIMSPSTKAVHLSKKIASTFNIAK